ncbi:MAG: hypothetical protein J4203_00320 [Candidatus Diapherotrites archaeon]|uniref:Carboxypeptidase regulatory-like domain-containing protein n=1 Tax=Candidatus Iainarchaeum sp. TaxID=3101447 RepID=A0A8T4L603_9ARCH|nr:hypothetical protein [Candidatus Diapherotrites archaeon]
MGKIRARALLVFVTLLALAWMAQGALAEEASLAERLGFTATGFDFAKVDLVLAAGILIVLCVVLYAVLAVFLKPQQGQSYEAPQELTVEGITGGETTPPRDESNPVMKFYYSLEDGWYNFLDGLNQVIPVYKIIDPIDQVIPSFALFLLLLLLLLVGGLYWGGAFNAPGPDGTGGGVLWPVVDWMGSLLGWKKADAAGVQFLVSDEQANPVAGAQVAVAYGEQAESYSTNEFGEFSMPVYQAEIFLDVQAEGFERFSENYSVNREGVNRVSLKRAPLYFAENRVLELVDEFGARVTEAVFVSFSCSGSYNAPASQSTTTGEVSVTYTGNCGTLMASIRAQGFEDQTVLMSGSRTVAVLKKKSADRLNGKLNVKLLGPQSESMTGMEIRLFDNDNIWKNTGKSDAAGSYSFTVTPGTYYVLVQDLAGKFTSTQSNKVPVDAGEEVLVEVRMSKAGTDGSGGDGGGTTCAPGKTLCANGQCQTSCGPGVLPACPAGQNRCADRTCQASCGPGPINCPTGTNLCQNGTCNATCPVNRPKPMRRLLLPGRLRFGSRGWRGAPESGVEARGLGFEGGNTGRERGLVLGGHPVGFERAHELGRRGRVRERGPRETVFHRGKRAPQLRDEDRQRHPIAVAERQSHRHRVGEVDSHQFGGSRGQGDGVGGGQRQASRSVLVQQALGGAHREGLDGGRRQRLVSGVAGGDVFCDGVQGVDAGKERGRHVGGREPAGVGRAIGVDGGRPQGPGQGRARQRGAGRESRVL